MAKHDGDAVLISLKNLAVQLADGLVQSRQLAWPKTWRRFDHILVSGMGGSNLAARILEAVFSDELKFPLLINADYELPGFVGKNSLVIAASYSGNTEETLHASREALGVKAKLVVLTTAHADNQLAALARRHHCPLLALTTEANPSTQPRLGLGYALAGLLTITQAAGLIKIKQKNLHTAINKLQTWGERLAPEKSNNTASRLADRLISRQILIISGQFLTGNTHALRNQFNENSKNFAAYLTVPEMNHYALEGLTKPATNAESLLGLIVESSLYSPRAQKRLGLTKQVLEKNKIKTVTVKLTGANKLEQSLEMLQLGAWISYYLALANEVDPADIPWVDWFKKELK